MPSKSDVRDMMLDPSKIKIPSTPAQQVAFADDVVSNLWDAKCPVEQDLLIKGFYKIMMHKDVSGLLSYIMIENATKTTDTICRTAACNRLLKGHEKEYSEWVKHYDELIHPDRCLSLQNLKKKNAKKPAKKTAKKSK